MVDQACGCEADSRDPDYSCDCAMQGLAYVAPIATVQRMYIKKLQKICN